MGCVCKLVCRSPAIVLIIEDTLGRGFGVWSVDDKPLGVDNKVEARRVECRSVHDLISAVASEAGVKPGCKQPAHHAPGLIPTPHNESLSIQTLSWDNWRKQSMF